MPFDRLSDVAAIAIIRRSLGPAYRPAGAAMLLSADGSRLGNLSSGCIDADIALRAAEVIASGRAADLRYGAGSPFRDLVLPCGGGLDIRILPLQDDQTASEIRAAIASRAEITLWLSTAQLATAPFDHADFAISLQPDLRFLVFGKGPEAIAFSQMTASAGYETWLSSPDPETIEQAAQSGIRPLAFPAPQAQASLPTDRWTAAVLLFHDHDLEPPLLQKLLVSEAFYIGAQGSLRAAGTRAQSLAALGVAPDHVARLQGPIGLIPSTRDPRTLAVSVLAEILSKAG